jgi:hypothetical protein
MWLWTGFLAEERLKTLRCEAEHNRLVRTAGRRKRADRERERG